MEILKKYLSAVNSLLDDLLEIVKSDESIHDLHFRNQFLNTRLKFESLNEYLDYLYNDHDFDIAVAIVKERGQVSISEISRTLNLRYNQSFAMVLRMEELEIITKPIDGIRYYSDTF